MESTKSSGVAKAGLTLGIIGTALGGLLATGGIGTNGNGNGLGNLFGTRTVNNTSGADNGYCQSWQGRVSELEAMLSYESGKNYTDQTAKDVYIAGVNNYKELNNKINNNLEKLYGFVIDLDKKIALNEQALRYENTILSNKIDCCCDKTNMRIDYNQQINQLADASIISYINSNFIPGTLKLPITSICPLPATATTTA